jgi:hypothetical protein
MARQPQRGAAALGLDRRHAERREDVIGVALDVEERLQVPEQLVGRAAREHERAPPDAQADAERGLVGTVPETSPMTAWTVPSGAWTAS